MLFIFVYAILILKEWRKVVFVLLADGFEEMEAICVIDILRRGGIEVKTAGLGGGLIQGSHGIIVKSDIPLGELDVLGADMIVLPGGPGHKKLLENDVVKRELKKAKDNDIKIGAICAAPAVLANAGVLDGMNATIYTGMENELKDAVYKDADVVVDGNIVTGRGPALAMEFALELLNQLKGEEVMHKIKKGLLYTK